MNDVLIGSGLIASAVYAKNKDLKCIRIKNTSYDKLVNNIFYLKSDWRQECILYSDKPNGLSSLYHGVMPAQLIYKYEIESKLCNYDFPKIKNKNLNNYTYVPFFPKRPNKTLLNKQDIFDEEVNSYGKLFLCSGVVGNIRYLIDKKLIEGQQILGDHIVVRIGTVDFEEIKSKFNIISFVTNRGTLFRHFDIDKFNTRIFFRPSMGENTSINFSKTVDGLGRFILEGKPFKKIISGIYNKTGFPKSKGKYDVYAQIPINEAYSINKNNIIEANNARINAIEIIHDLHISLKQNFVTFKPFDTVPENIIPGIHLFYDRKILRDIDSSIKVYDTSLCPDKKAHPTIWSSLIAYELS